MKDTRRVVTPRIRSCALACYFPVWVACSSDSTGGAKASDAGGDATTPATGGAGGTGGGARGGASGSSDGGHHRGPDSGAGGAAAGGASGGGAGGKDGGGDASDARAPDAAPNDAGSGCGDPTKVCVDVPGTPAAFFDASGAVLKSGIAPIAWTVPDGGSVLASAGVGVALHFDVPAGTTLRRALPVTPAAPTDLQDIQVDIPAPPNSATVLSATGCLQSGGAKELTGTGTKHFVMTSACLENGKAAFFASAGDAYVYVEGISLGADSAADLVVNFPAWKTVSQSFTFTLDALPSGVDPRVSYFIRYGSGELLNETLGFQVTGTTGVATIDLDRTVGAEWFRFVQIGGGSSSGPSAWIIDSRSVGHPLSADSMSVTTDLLPTPGNITVSERTVSWDFQGGRAPAGADRVVAFVHGTGTSGDTGLWVVAAPSRRSVTIPDTLPADFQTFALTTVDRADVYVEDLASVNDYPSALEAGPGLLQFPGSVEDSLGRQSYRAGN